MKVSVVIPAHNEESFIEAALQAALKQDYSDFEIIVVDNGSTDRTAELAQRLGVKVFFEKRKGTCWARERGRREAKGEVIASLDADCLPDPDWLREGVKWFTSKEIVAVTGPYDHHDSGRFFRIFSIFFQKHIYHFANNILQEFHKGAVLIAGNAFLRADALEKSGGYDTNIIFYGDDTDTAKRISKGGKVIYDKKLLMKTSARRFKAEGSIKISILYIYHFFKVIFSNA